jgi:hypothetical protein
LTDEDAASHKGEFDDGPAYSVKLANRQKRWPRRSTLRRHPHSRAA